MNKAFLTSLLLTATSVHAASAPVYRLDVELKRDSSVVGSARLTVQDGHSGSVQNDGHFIEVVPRAARYQGRSGVDMAFVVGVTNPDGTRTLISRPRILTVEGERGTITVGRLDRPRETITLSVLAERQSP